MTEDDYLKVTIGLASAFAGWLLAQLTSGAKAWLQRRKVSKLLLEELSDLEQQIDRLLIFYYRQLQIHGAQAVSSESAAGLTNPIFANYYKDALLSLNQRQRISYQLIHALVAQVNIGLDELRQKAYEIYKRHNAEGMSKSLSKLCEAWGVSIKAQHLSCASLKWQIQYHLQNRNGPDLSPYRPTHEEYLQYLKAAEEKAESWIENGKTISPSAFDELYNPGAFSREPNA